MENQRFLGRQVVAELYNCKIDLEDSLAVSSFIRETIVNNNAYIVESFVKESSDTKSYVFVISESHVIVTVYRLTRTVMLDVFTCGLVCDPEKIFKSFLYFFNPVTYEKHFALRGCGLLAENLVETAC